MSEETELSKEVWHKTKGISISIIALLLINIISTVWWAATLTSDVSQLKERPNLTERVIRLETLTEVYQSGFNRTIALIDKLEQKVSRIDRELAKRTDSIHTHKFKGRI